MGEGLTLIHELNHTMLGGSKNDAAPFSPDLGDADVMVNAIRAEMGPDWGQRMIYGPMIGANMQFYIPFDQQAKDDLFKNYKIPTTKFIKIKAFENR